MRADGGFWCMGLDDPTPSYEATDQDVKRWRTHCNPELMLPPSVDVPLSEQAKRWQELWVQDLTHVVENRLELSFWKQMGEVDSDVSSVEGGEIEDCHNKICRYPECPHDVREDVDNEMNTGLRHLYLCSACNKGFHSECVRLLNTTHNTSWSIPTDDIPEWRCGDCVPTRTLSCILAY